jgi:hypothetical protein
VISKAHNTLKELTLYAIENSVSKSGFEVVFGIIAWAQGLMLKS